MRIREEGGLGQTAEFGVSITEIATSASRISYIYCEDVCVCSVRMSMCVSVLVVYSLIYIYIYVKSFNVNLWHRRICPLNTITTSYPKNSRQRWNKDICRYRHDTSEAKSKLGPPYCKGCLTITEQ